MTMKHLNIINLTEENYKQHIPLHPIAFSYAEGGACGHPCLVEIVDKDKTVYYFFTYELKEEIAREVLPANFECKFGWFGQDNAANGWHGYYLGMGNHLMVSDTIFQEFNSIAEKIENPGILYQEWINIIVYGYLMTTEFGEIQTALDYIGVEQSDFTLTNSMFTRPKHDPIHGIGHIYRTMIGCALIAHLLQKPREGLLAFCGAYIHDLARETDGEEPEHGAMAVVKYFEKFNYLWDKYGLTEEERLFVQKAVTQHSIREQMTPKDDGYDVMAILKDADALDRCRIGDLNPRWLRYPESRMLVTKMKEIYKWTQHVNSDLSFRHFVSKVVW